MLVRSAKYSAASLKALDREVLKRKDSIALVSQRLGRLMAGELSDAKSAQAGAENPKRAHARRA
jgi:hypothetical protein